jgi:hypothetical protein
MQLLPGFFRFHGNIKACKIRTPDTSPSVSSGKSLIYVKLQIYGVG